MRLGPVMAGVIGLLLNAGGSGLGQVAPSRALRPEDAIGNRYVAYLMPPQLSPDGRWVSYTVIDPTARAALSRAGESYGGSGVPSDAAGAEIWLTDTETGETRLIGAERSSTWGAAWSPDGQSVAFYSDRDGAARLWLYDLRTGTVRRIAAVDVHPFFGFESPKWSADGRLIVVKVKPSSKGATPRAARARVPASEPLVPGSTVRVYRTPADQASHNGATDTSNTVVPNGIVDRDRSDLVAIAVSDGRTRPLVRREAVRDYWISPGEQYVAFTIARGTRTATSVQPVYDIHVVSLTDGRALRVAADVAQWWGISVSWSPDGRHLAYVTMPQATRSGAQSAGAANGDCYVVDIDRRETKKITAGAHPPFRAMYDGDPGEPLWDERSRNVYLLGGDTLWRADVADGRVRAVAALSGRELRSIVARVGSGRYWSTDSGRSLYLVTRNIESRDGGMARVDLSSGRVTLLWEEQRAIALNRDILGIDAAADRIAYLSQDAQHPQAVWVSDPGGRPGRAVSHLNPMLDRYSFGDARLIRWRGADGEVLHGALLLPAGYRVGERYPLIVNIYGGSRASDQVYRFGLDGDGPLNLQLFATRGYAVLYPDVPLNTHTPMLDMAKAVLPGVNHLIDAGIADPDRLGIMGESYGGYSVLALITQTQRFKAAIVQAGSSDLVTEYSQLTSDGGSPGVGWAEEGQGRMGGSPWEVRERYIENSPFYYLDRVTTPVLLIHGSADEAVPAVAGAQTFVALRRLGKDAAFVLYEGEGHSTSQYSAANALDYMSRIVAWFQRYLRRPATPTMARKLSEMRERE